MQCNVAGTGNQDHLFDTVLGDEIVEDHNEKLEPNIETNGKLK